MNKYHVYGIGNALVDIDVSLEDALLESMKVEKGVMTLIDEDRHFELLSHVSELNQVKGCGGSAANTLIAVSQLGGRGFYSCKVANDHAGDIFIKDLMNHGLDSNLNMTNRCDGVTGKCLVMVTPDAERTMNTHLGITETLSVDEVDEKSLCESEYLYMEGYVVTSPTGRKAAIHAREIAEKNGVKTSITLSDPNMTRFFKQGLLEMIGERVDLLFCNQEEALLFADTGSVDDAIDYLKAYSQSFVMTKGESGALLFDGEQLIDIPTTPVQALDTVGAGDMFAGAFLYGITHGYEWGDAVKLANRASAEVVSIYGSRLSDKSVNLLLSREILSCPQ